MPTVGCPTPAEMIAAGPGAPAAEYHCAARSPWLPHPPTNATSYWPGCRLLTWYRPPAVTPNPIAGTGIKKNPPLPAMLRGPEKVRRPGVVATTQTPPSPLPEVEVTRPPIVAPGRITALIPVSSCAAATGTSCGVFTFVP